MAVPSDFKLSEEQKAHFMQYGFIKVPKCFTKAQADEFSAKVWIRLGMDPEDRSTWNTERVNMPKHNHIQPKDFAPKAWAAMCELVGGEDRIDMEQMEHEGWNDSFIVNLGKEEYDSNAQIEYRELNGWHNDGDFFVHFLDSPEQALLVIPLWSDVPSRGGGTAICSDGIKAVAEHLYKHPEGTNPYMISRDEPGQETNTSHAWWQNVATSPSITRDSTFFEATGEVGDVYLLHPFMLHSASKNLIRTHRIITNPPLSLKEPFNYDRKDPKEYSLVELKTLKDLGMEDGLKGWKITKERAPWIPERLKRQAEIKELELERLAKLEAQAA